MKAFEGTADNVELNFEPIYGGANGVGIGEPLCFILEVDKVKILLDCGWDIHFNVETIAPLLKINLSQIDLVLVTHPDIEVIM
mmetsp:Transcript_24458/g.36729  ORF Transcript_24458/g.36729 Transcript_24458/m.36729 type:complete len:83 (-) Transcript_24458:322-570(-)